VIGGGTAAAADDRRATLKPLLRVKRISFRPDISRQRPTDLIVGVADIGV
jgi:hypothetical protein